MIILNIKKNIEKKIFIKKTKIILYKNLIFDIFFFIKMLKIIFC